MWRYLEITGYAVIALIEIAISCIEIVFSSIVGMLGIVRVWFFRDYDYRKWLKRDLRDCQSILEIGCGANSPILKIGYGRRTTAIEIFRPYVDKHNWLGSYQKCSHQDALTFDYPEKAFDAVVILDVLEHLDRKQVEQIDLFGKMERCARKRVICFTPNGFIENDLVDGDPHQAHVSAWEPVDYEKRGYTVVGATGLRYFLGKGSLPKYHPYSAFFVLAMLSQPIIFGNPNLAWHSYAVKEIQ
jgi:hypothetical protein